MAIKKIQKNIAMEICGFPGCGISVMNCGISVMFLGISVMVLWHFGYGERLKTIINSSISRPLYNYITFITYKRINKTGPSYTERVLLPDTFVVEKKLDREGYYVIDC